MTQINQGNKIKFLILVIISNELEIYKLEITKLGNKIPSITGLATNAALTAAEKIIPYFSSLVKKKESNTKITEIYQDVRGHYHDKHITTPEFKVTAEKLAVGLKEANLVTKTDCDDKSKSFNEKINSNKAKHLVVVNNLKKTTFDSNYYRRKSNLEEHGTQNYVVFQPMKKGQWCWWW